MSASKVYVLSVNTNILVILSFTLQNLSSELSDSFPYHLLPLFPGQPLTSCWASPWTLLCGSLIHLLPDFVIFVCFILPLFAGVCLSKYLWGFPYRPTFMVLWPCFKANFHLLVILCTESMFINLTAKVLIKSLLYLGGNPFIVVLVGFGTNQKAHMCVYCAIFTQNSLYIFFEVSFKIFNLTVYHEVLPTLLHILYFCTSTTFP